MAYTSPPKTFTAGNVLTAADLNTYLRDAIEALFPVGYLGMIHQAATSVETLVNGVWLECNGTAVSRSTYSALNTLLSGQGYPDGSGDGSTTFNLPDYRGRTFIHHSPSSGNAATKTMGLSDSAALASRTPKPSVSVSISGTTGSHTHGAGSYVVTLPANANAVGGSTSPLAGGVSVTGTSGSSTASFSGSGSGTATTAYLVGGIYVIKAFT